MAKQVYNKIFNDEEWSQVNEENIDIIEDYLEELKQQKKKESTIKQYRNDLRIILLYILRKCKNKSILELGRKDFRKFSLWLSEDLKVSNARVNRLLSACRSLLDYCENDDELEYEVNFAKKVKGLPKEAVRTDEDYFFISFAEVYELRNALIELGRLQDAVLLMLAYDSGGRRNEVAQVLKEGLTEANRTNEVVGKGGKRFRLVYLNDTKELISRYLDERGEDDIESLFITEHGGVRRALDYEGLYTRFKSMLKVLSEIKHKPYNLPFHGLRHSRAESLVVGEDTRLLDENGKPRKFKLEEIKVLLNHNSVATTELYVKDKTDEVLNGMFNI